MSVTKKLPFRWQNHGSGWRKDVINQCFEFGVGEVMMLINQLMIIKVFEKHKILSTETARARAHTHTHTYTYVATEAYFDFYYTRWYRSETEGETL